MRATPRTSSTYTSRSCCPTAQCQTISIRTVKDYRKYLDKYWRVDEMYMVNHLTGKSTKLTMSNYKFRTGLKDSDFSQNSLRRIR